mgnify:CR=1 FL=1
MVHLCIATRSSTERQAEAPWKLRTCASHNDLISITYTKQTHNSVKPGIYSRTVDK